MTLRDLAEFEVKNRLLAVPGVAAVERLGGYLRQFQIQLDPTRMAARNVTLDDVLHAVEDANVNASGGFVAQGGTEWAVRAVGRVQTIDELRTTVVAVKDGVPVMLGDIADVREAPAVRRGVAHRLAGEVVSCRVVKQFGADTVTVAAAVRAAIAEISRTLPEGVALRMVYDQSTLVETALGGVSRAILIGAVLVVVVLFVLLGNWRAALLVTVTLPLSIELSGLLLRAAGIGINTMTLGGLAIAVGLLVDAAIIVTENIVHHLQRRDGCAEARGGARGSAGGRPPDPLRHAHRDRGVRAALRDDRHRGPHVPAARGRGRRGAGRVAGAGADAGSGRRGAAAAPSGTRAARRRVDRFVG